jgi:hypothetical protein
LILGRVKDMDLVSILTACRNPVSPVILFEEAVSMVFFG